MTIKPMPKTRGAQTAAILCDGCHREEVVSCGYEGGQPSPKQANQAAQRIGWHVSGHKMSCQACRAKARAAESIQRIQPKEMEVKQITIDAPRRPTPKQERLIVMALEDHYDDGAQRYKLSATDKTVADELGDGIMFGWVTEVRERYFGPSGSNEEIDALRAEMESIRLEFETRISSVSKRIDAVVAAVGPKAKAAA